LKLIPDQAGNIVIFSFSFAGSGGLFSRQFVALYERCYSRVVVAKFVRKPSLEVVVYHHYSLELLFTRLIPDARQRELLSLEP
jgi:hypothetical protein